MNSLIRSPRTLAALLPLALAAGCDSYYSAEIDAPEICVGGLTLPFPPSSENAYTDQPISGDELGIPDSDSLDLELMVMSFGFAPIEGVDDLGFIDTMNIRASSAEDSEMPEMRVVDMDPADHHEDGSMSVEPDEPADLGPMFARGDILFHVNVTGELPDTLWQTRMELCMHARARYADEN